MDAKVNGARVCKETIKPTERMVISRETGPDPRQKRIDRVYLPSGQKTPEIFLVFTPDTKVFPVSEGARSKQRTSAPCPWKLCSSCPLSTSHRAHVPSPLAVRICVKRECRGRLAKGLPFQSTAGHAHASYAHIHAHAHRHTHTTEDKHRKVSPTAWKASMCGFSV